MTAALVVSVTYAVLGLLYAPGLYSFVALLFVAVSCSPFIVAAFLEPSNRPTIHPQVGGFFFWTAWALGMLNLWAIALAVGRVPSDLISIDGIVGTAAIATARRYEEQGASGNPVVLAVSLFLLYRLGAAEATTSWIRKLLGFVPLVLYALISTEKWPMFLGGVFFLSGVFVTYQFKEAKRIVFRYFLLFVWVGGALAGVAVLLRGFEGDVMDIPLILIHYTLAPYPALGHWLLNSAVQDCCTVGALSFIGTLDALGLAQRAAGVYSENYTVYGAETNIFTAWRYLVQDFSLFGPLLLNSLLTVTYIAARVAKVSSVEISIKVFVIVSALLSVNVTAFVHNSTALSLALALIYSSCVVFWLNRHHGVRG